MFIVLCLLAAPLGVNAQTLVFHLAGGEKTTVFLPATFTVKPSGDKLVIAVDGSDDIELSKDEIMCVTYRDAKGDVNGDQRVDVADVSTLVGLLIGKDGGDNSPDGAVAVDLGLPSGTKWANMNVGATAEEDYGLFFAWGETVGYSSSDTDDGRSFDWASYKWMTKGKSSWEWINKYQIEDNKTEGCWYDTNYKFIGDGKTELTPADDAAHTNWGGDWYMPTIADIEELLNNTTSEWTTLKGVNGRKFTSKKNGNAIFLPAAGLRYSSSLGTQSAGGDYWSASFLTTGTDYAHGLYFHSGSAFTSHGDRCFGHSVRPILRK